MPDEYLLYLRKSVGRAGISRQRTVTTGHLAKLGGTVAGEFVDTDSTAYALPGQPPPPRKDFQRLLAAMAARPGVGVAAWHVDRFLRDSGDTAVFARACIAGGHLVVTARGGTYDLTTANGRKRLRDDASDAEHEIDHLRERVLDKMTELRAEGRWSGGRRPFGFDVDGGSPGGLVLREAEAALVRQGTAALLAGGSLTSVARDWAASGLSGSLGGAWTHVLVRQVLVRSLNAGLISYRGEVTGPGAWPAIVTEAEWRACRAILADPARKTSPGPERRHMLSGLALCGTCGTELGIAGYGSHGASVPVYRCRSRLPRDGRRPGRDERGRHATRSAAQLDDYVTVLALGRLHQDDAAALLRPDHQADRAALLADEAAEQAEYDSLWPLRLARAITDRELMDGRAKIGERLERVRRQLAALDQADALAPFVASPDGAWQRADVRQRRAVIAALMRVTVFPSRQGRPPGTPRLDRWFDAGSVDIRWVRPLPSDDG